MDSASIPTPRGAALSLKSDTGSRRCPKVEGGSHTIAKTPKTALSPFPNAQPPNHLLPWAPQKQPRTPHPQVSFSSISLIRRRSSLQKNNLTRDQTRTTESTGRDGEHCQAGWWGDRRGLDTGPFLGRQSQGSWGRRRRDAFRGSPGPVVEGFRLQDFKKQQIKSTMVSGAD